MKSPETTIAILLTVLFLAFILGVGAGEQMRHDCRLKAMEKQYPAIEIQGICK